MPLPTVNGDDNLEIPLFSDSLYGSVTPDQQKILQGFERRVETGKDAAIPIRQSDFLYGSLRITKPGYYKLRENIVFNPIHQFPQKDQLDRYPVGKNGPFHLGFFAAITIETDNVILDLNGMSITQSPRHNLLQRFFSCIELANSPFIPKQGPHDFIQNYHPAANTLIMNGFLINSSHHGIHGNTNKNIVLHRVVIEEFEVAGIALNGAKNCVISECELTGKFAGIPVLSSFSQARFSARALENLNDVDNEVYARLDADLQNAFREITQGLPQTTYFENPSGQYDGNMYGIVLNVNGIVVHDFLEERPVDAVNDDITLFDISIRNIVSQPEEILSLPVTLLNEENQDKNAYGGKQMVGAFGDVFDIERLMTEERKYKGNSLSDTQLYLAEKYPDHGSVNIEPPILEWAKNSTPLPLAQSFLPTGDSMGHIMKGNIGVFISGGENIKLEEVVIDNVGTTGQKVGTSPLLVDDDRYFQGASSYGILMTATNDDAVELVDVVVSNIYTQQPKAVAKKIERL
jgi:hypothetical protein